MTTAAVVIEDGGNMSAEGNRGRGGSDARAR
jgi:hypothetical protein